MFLCELKFYSLLLIFTFLPGMALVPLFFRQISLDLYILLSVVLGLFVWTVLSTVGFIFALPLSIVIMFWIGGVVISGFWILFLILKNRMVRIQPFKVDTALTVLITFITFSALLVYWKGSFQDGDAWYHVAQAVNYLNQPQMVSENAFFSGFPAGTLYDFNAWHTFIAAIAMLGRFQANFVWINLSAFFFPITILAIYTYIKTVFTNRYFAITAVIAIFFFHTLQAKFMFLTSSVIPGNICTAFLMPLFFTIYFSEIIKRRQLLLISILFVATFIHIYYFLVIIGYLLVFHIFYFIINPDSRLNFIKGTIKSAGYFLVGLPLLIAIYWYCLRHYAETFPGTELPLTMLFKDWPIFSVTPDKWPFYLSVTISFLLLIKSPHWRKNRSRLFILSSILIVPLLIFNPLLLKFFSQFVPLNLIGRLTAPFFLLIPILWLIWKLFPKRFILNRFHIIGLISVVIIFGLSFLSFLPDSIKNRIQTYDKYREPMGFHDFAVRFQQVIPPNSVVITDSYTSYHLPVFADIDIVAMTAHSTPPLNLKTRIRDNYRFFNPLISPDLKNSIKEKYRIEYAAINSSIFPWIKIGSTDTLFKANLYPDYIPLDQNTCVINLANIHQVTSLNFPVFVNFHDIISVYPPASSAILKDLTWEHAGMIFIKIINPLDKLSFHSKGGTHHIFYYSVLNGNFQIINEKVFINNFSPQKIYQLNNLAADSWVVFSGNGLSPLTVQIN